MATMLEGSEGAYVVSTLVKEGKRRKVSRGRVLVFGDGFAEVLVEAEKQAKAARRLFGVQLALSEPVV